MQPIYRIERAIRSIDRTFSLNRLARLLVDKELFQFCWCPLVTSSAFLTGSISPWSTWRQSDEKLVIQILSRSCLFVQEQLHRSQNVPISVPLPLLTPQNGCRYLEDALSTCADLRGRFFTKFSGRSPGQLFLRFSTAKRFLTCPTKPKFDNSISPRHLMTTQEEGQSKVRE